MTSTRYKEHKDMSTYKISKFLKSILFALVVTMSIGLLTPIDVSAGGSLSLSDKGYTLKQVV